MRFIEKMFLINVFSLSFKIMNAFIKLASANITPCRRKIKREFK